MTVEPLVIHEYPTMGELVRLPLSAALFVFAVVAELAGFISIDAAVACACVATALLIWADVRYMMRKPGIELWQLIVVQVAGTWILISLLLIE